MERNKTDNIEEIIAVGASVLQDAIDGITALQPSKTTEMLGVSDVDRGLAVARKLDETQDNLGIIVLKLAQALTEKNLSQRAVATSLKIPPNTLNRRLNNDTIDQRYKKLKPSPVERHLTQQIIDHKSKNA